MSERKKFDIRPAKSLIVREPEAKHFEIQKPLSEVEPIEEGSLTPRSRDDLVRLVEAPLLLACQILFDKRVQTWMSSANKKDITSGEVYLILNFDTLSPQNKQMAMKYGVKSRYLNTEYIKISMPVSEQTTSQEISKHMVAIANEFENQQ